MNVIFLFWYIRDWCYFFYGYIGYIVWFCFNVFNYYSLGDVLVVVVIDVFGYLFFYRFSFKFNIFLGLWKKIFINNLLFILIKFYKIVIIVID